MARLCEANLCTGCTACASICPYGCISMRADQEGFVRPVVDEKRCVECGLCTKACPVLSAPEKNPMPAAFAVRGVFRRGGFHTGNPQILPQSGDEGLTQGQYMFV